MKKLVVEDKSSDFKSYWKKITGYTLLKPQCASINQLILQYNYEEVIECTNIAVSKHWSDRIPSYNRSCWEDTFESIRRIAYVRQQDKVDPLLKRIYRIRMILINRAIIEEWQKRHYSQFLRDAIEAGANHLKIELIAKEVFSEYEFRDLVLDLIN